MPTIDDSVLLVVDVQVGFVSPASAPVVPVIAKLAAKWQAAGGATVFTQFVNAPESQYVRVIGWEALMPGTSEVAFAPEVEPFVSSASLVVQKITYSALTVPVLDFIARTGRKNVWVSGLDTESCVLATTFSAFDANLDPWLLTDACASHAGASVHEAGLLVASRNIGAKHLVTTADIPIDREVTASQAPHSAPIGGGSD